MEQRKIVILGAGHVGSHCAYALAASGVCEDIVLVDVVPGKAHAQPCQQNAQRHKPRAAAPVSHPPPSSSRK